MSRRLPRKSGFTIMETLVAVTIAVIMLSSIILANRAITTGLGSSADTQQLSTLADEAINSLRFLKDSQQSAAEFESLIFPTGQTTTQGMLFAKSGTDSNPEINWCIPGGSSNIQSCPDSLVSVAGNASPQLDRGDVIAVERTSSQVGGSASRVVDLLTPRTGGGGEAAISTGSTDLWYFYTRKITISKGLSGVDNSYQVTVVTTNFNNPRVTLTKTALLTFWK